MRVRLISYSQPSAKFFNETGMYSLEDLVAHAARVSNPTNQMNKETAPRLINYLIKNKHWSPLEMVSATLEISTTRDIARQILRHRSFSFQEFSQRYADPTQMEFELKEARLQDPKNRQNSVEVDDPRLHDEWKRHQAAIAAQSSAAYKWAIDNGIAKEQARAVMPEGITASRMYMSGTLRSWVHYIQLRSSNGTQKEHMEIARECGKVLSDVFPMITEFVEQ
jgi:thymidylate synthase (FAD)